EKKALRIFRQLLEAFKVLNRFNIMHRDIKPENIFFSYGKVKLGDFGFCKGLKDGEYMAKTMLGSPIYMAPEVLKGERYTIKADIWSLGVVLFEMLFGVCPFRSNSIAMLITTINKQ
ncbi:hypothetical protein DAPPUDRAFT_72758, partial [Daphnia pulex]